MTLEDSVHGLRLHAIQRAQAVGNVSAVCRELGISRTLFYRWRARWERYGVDGVHPRRQRARPGRPIQVTPEVERMVVALAISAATSIGDSVSPASHAAELGLRKKRSENAASRTSMPSARSSPGVRFRGPITVTSQTSP